MAYVKHPAHGNRHVSEDEAARLVSEGWTRFPRTKEEKARGPFNGAPPASGFGSLLLVDATQDGAPPSTVEAARKALDAKGIKFDKRWGLAKLLEALEG